MSEFTTLATGLSFTECPRWRDGRLYLSDMYTHRVLAISMDGATELIARVPQPSGLGFLPDGRLLIVSMRERKILRRDADGSLSTYADLYSLAPWHLNDMLVDRDGRAWVGNFGFDLMGAAPTSTTVLIRVETDGSAKVVAQDLGFPNGMVLTPDGRTLIVAETWMNRLTAFTVHQGTLSERRVWAAFGPPPTSRNATEALRQADAAADGICLDAEGAVWVADAAHRRLLRVDSVLAFELTGILYSVAAPLADANISIFAISSFDTDYILIADHDIAPAIVVLESAGHKIHRSLTQ